MKNMIPIILKQRGWSKYRLWKELGQTETDRALVYSRLCKRGAETRPIPPQTQWGTLARVAGVLGVSMSDLEAE